MSSWYPVHLLRLPVDPALSLALTPELSPRDVAMRYVCMYAPLSLDFQKQVLADGLRDPNLPRRQPAEQGLAAVPSAARALLLSNNFLAPKGPWVYTKHRK